MKSVMKKMTLKKKRAEVGMDNSKEHDLDTVSETAIPENSMKAVEYYSYGGGHEGLKIANLPIPTPQKDEVLIKMEAASINAVDCKIKQGAMKPVLPFRFPHTPGADVSGEVVRVGPGVTTFVPGDKVVSCTGRSGGGLAEYVIASISTTVKRPHYVSAIDGAALGVSAFAALQSVRNSANISLDGRKQEPKNLLITNGSGGVGSLAVQIAKIGGAHVTVTCGARNFEFLRSLGADEVIDYKTPEGAALKSPSGKKYDVIINCAPHQPFKLYKAQLAPTGFVIDMNPSPKGLFTSAVHVASFSKQKYYPFMHIPNSMDMYFLFNLIQTKKLTTVIDSTFPLAKSQEAWAKCMEGHAVGKIVITCAQGSQQQVAYQSFLKIIFWDAVNLCTAKVKRYQKLVDRDLNVLFVNFEDAVIAQWYAFPCEVAGSDLNNELYFDEEPFALDRHQHQAGLPIFHSQVQDLLKMRGPNANAADCLNGVRKPFGVQGKKATRQIFVKEVLVLEGTERDWWVIDPEGDQKAD